MTSLELESLCKNYKIFVDTNALMLENAEIFHKNIHDALYQTNTKIILAMRVYNEIKKVAESTDNNTRSRAKYALKVVEHFNNSNLLDVREEENEVIGGSKIFADAVFPMVFSKNRLKHNLCLITQDAKLAIDMLNIKYSQSITSYKDMKIVFIHNRTYSLHEWEPRLERTHGLKWEPQSINGTTQKSTNRFTQENAEKFNLCSSPLIEKERLLSVSKLPSVGEYVFTSKLEKIYLKKFIASGGEGELFETNNGLVCKIYKQERLTNLRKRKLELMLNKNILIKGVCLPKKIVFNDQNQFVGYLMDKAQGHILQTSVFGKPVLKNKFPKWKRENLVQLALTIVQTIEKLHNVNIIIGDINPNNILVVDENTVFFVDTDSYQVENFPCPVGTPIFTAPELQGFNYADILRTKEHEMFAVATLIFMILFPGKTPYSSQGGEDLIANIKNRNFSYVREKDEADKKPFGPWRFIWSHLHFELKKNFEEVFSKGCKVAIEDWAKALGYYLKGIKEGHSSNELFPSSYRVQDGISMNCVECGKKELVSKVHFDKIQSEGWKFRCSRCREIYKLRMSMKISQPTQNNSSHAYNKPTQNQHKPNNSSVSKNNSGLLNFIKNFFS
ncbi:protein kinase domain-containing protein [Thiospirillum jenense]|uniref:Protein kinase domain-containing protein n=1 Tax=Thiospirillum jenense TaxID=1653858 RepID=A0A839HCR2_9GAMM|nr:hypothetical protein [Thiospirillum jenense]MBB1126713.1 hypothetical protein [Thiospirillum jenense]